MHKDVNRRLTHYIRVIIKLPQDPLKSFYLAKRSSFTSHSFSSDFRAEVTENMKAPLPNSVWTSGTDSETASCDRGQSFPQSFPEIKKHE